MKLLISTYPACRLEALVWGLQKEGLLAIIPMAATLHPLAAGQAVEVMAVGSDFKKLKELTDRAKEMADLLADKEGPLSLCILVEELLEEKERLVNYGQRALTQKGEEGEALELAGRLGGISLSVHGPSPLDSAARPGHLALAALGLRLGGDQGIFSEGLLLEEPAYRTLEELLSLEGIDEVRHVEGLSLSLHQKIYVAQGAQTLLRDHKSVLFVKKCPDKGYCSIEIGEDNREIDMPRLCQ